MPKIEDKDLPPISIITPTGNRRSLFSIAIKNFQSFIYPKDKYTIKNNKIKTDFDHRIAMSFVIMGSLLEKDLFIDEFIQECKNVKQKVELRKHHGYGHSYYFIQTFIKDHFDFHSKKLN